MITDPNTYVLRVTVQIGTKMVAYEVDKDTYLGERVQQIIEEVKDTYYSYLIFDGLGELLVRLNNMPCEVIYGHRKVELRNE